MISNTGYPVVDHIVSSDLNGIPVGAIGVILSDLAKMRFLAPKKLFPVVIIIYRFSNDIWSIFNTDGKLIGGFYSKKEGTYVTGKEIMVKSGEWISNSSLIEPNIQKAEEVIAKKFSGVHFVYQKM